MAVNEAIRSEPVKQPTAPSPKLRIYEALFRLNQSMDQVATALRGMMKFPFARKESLRCAHDEIEEVRAGVNAEFVEELGDRERNDEGRFWKRRRRYERKLEDPDDVYIHLERREKERTSLRLPSRIGVIPDSAVSSREEPKRPYRRHPRAHNKK